MSKHLKPAAAVRRPVLFITAGRQRVGKTTFLNSLIQALRDRGAEMTVWNADQLNVTYNLSLFHSDVLRPPSSEFEDVKAWLVERIQDQIDGQYDVLLDVAGGDSPLSRLVTEIPIVETLENAGIRIVLAHVVGPEQADADYLKYFTMGHLFAPDATLIVLNGGLVLSGCSVASAFADIMQNPAVAEALEEGAETVTFPALGCMSQITDRGISFADAVEGRVKPGQKRLSFFDRARTRIWWQDYVPAFLAKINPDWLPGVQEPFAVPADSQPTALEAADA